MEKEQKATRETNRQRVEKKERERQKALPGGFLFRVRRSCKPTYSEWDEVRAHASGASSAGLLGLALSTAAPMSHPWPAAEECFSSGGGFILLDTWPSSLRRENV